jgi:hypothetical protein
MVTIRAVEAAGRDAAPFRDRGRLVSFSAPGDILFFNS